MADLAGGNERSAGSREIEALGEIPRSAQGLGGNITASGRVTLSEHVTIDTGATRALFDPMNAPAPITVFALKNPS